MLSVTRTGRTHFASEVCTPAEFAQMRPAFETMARDLRAPLIVKPAAKPALGAVEQTGCAERPAESLASTPGSR